jgi:hypothetical protein
MSTDTQQSSGTTSTDALEGFQLLVKTSTGKQCVMVLKQVLKHPQIFVFGEMLEMQNIKEVQTSTLHRQQSNRKNVAGKIQFDPSYSVVQWTDVMCGVVLLCCAAGRH